MKLGILPLTGNNIASICNALPKGTFFEIIKEKTSLDSFTHLILPGVGHAAKLSEGSKSWREALLNYKGSVLGICLGMQFMFDFLEEGEIPGLGLVSGKVTTIQPNPHPVPNMGWHPVHPIKKSPLLKGIEESSFYFVHSFACPVGKETLCRLEYNGHWTAIVQKNSWIGTQFHPEKSGRAGLQFLKNYLEFSP
ncbi:MAG: imidazole glycerol phosphate synthase subunit HisH [Pseudomonadota bacterium]